MKTTGHAGGRPPKLYAFGGAKLSLTDWAEVSGIPRHIITDRLKDGWTFADAVIILPRARHFNPNDPAHCDACFKEATSSLPKSRT